MVSLKIPSSMQKEEYSGSIWKPYNHIILNMHSTHQCYGLNIDLKLHNAYLGKLSTQFSISNSTLTQLLCRRAGAVSTPADILHWGILQRLTWYQGLTAGWGEGADEAWGWPADIGLSRPHGLCSQLWGSTHTLPCHPSPGHRLMRGSALFRSPGWKLPTHLVSHLSNTAQSTELTATASVPLSPVQWSQLQIAAAHLGGCDLYPDFSSALFMPGMLI